MHKREMGSSIYEVKQRELKGYSYSAAMKGELACL